MKHLSLTRTMLTLAACAALLSSCELDGVNALTEGLEESYTIQDKNAGTLTVRENFKDYVALYEFTADENGNLPDGVKSIEFTADGTYHITFADDGTRQTYYAPAHTIDVEVEGRTVSVPMRSVTRSTYDQRKSTGTYTYRDGHYVIMDDYNWELAADGTLILTEDGVTHQYQATPVTPRSVDSLTDRLCHTWTLSRVLLKLYNGQKLVVTYHLTQEEMDEYCVDTFVFTTFGTFKRYAKGLNNGNGLWNWKVEKEQSMSYTFTYFSDSDPVPVTGSNDLMVYFTNNHLYLTEECEGLNDDDMEDSEGNAIHLKAVLLYQLDVKGN